MNISYQLTSISIFSSASVGLMCDTTSFIDKLYTHENILNE